MSNEQLILKDFENIPMVEDKDEDIVIDSRNPRFPLFEKIMTLYGDEDLIVEGLKWFDDGEDRFLLTFDIASKYERMLIAKVIDPEVGHAFTENNALLIEARYTKNSDRFLGVNYFLLDFSSLNGAGEKNDWISLFWADELDQHRIDELLIEKPEDLETVGQKVRGWWALSPIDAER